MPKRTVTARNLPAVLARFTHYALDIPDGEAKTAFCREFNAFLDAQANEDAFGTEGQCDPRGDQRD